MAAQHPPRGGTGIRALEPDKILETLGRLQARITERFPNSGLLEVCGDIVATGRLTADRAHRIGRPNYIIRGGIALALGLGIAAQVWVSTRLNVDTHLLDVTGAVQAAEAAANLVVLVGAAIWSLLSVEAAWKRRRVLEALHELRSFAHIVDMHQLVKDPTVVLQKTYTSTAHSPERTMTRFLLTRYLEYCAEILALIGKLAALYAERLHDAQVLDAVNDVEDLTTSLGRKIWQKIVILGQLEEG